MNEPDLSVRAKASACVSEILDAEFFRALCEPARLELISVLVRLGRSDVTTIAREMTQDRSVVSRHLQVLERAGIVQSRREGRHVFHELDGPAVAAKLDRIARDVRTLAPLCCPGPSG